MTDSSRFCISCGAQIPDGAPEAACPGCLLEAGLPFPPDEHVIAGDLAEDVGAGGEDTLRIRHAPRGAAFVGQLGDYELLEEVGRGAQGAVFRARQKSLNRIVALKIISLGQWASKAHLKRFRREAEAAARLDHPNIVPIYEVGERDGCCYFSMKFVDGGRLDDVTNRRPFSIRQATELLAKVARTVHYAHEHGILHRDIKPGNILLDAKGEHHLTDFGLARLVETDSTVTHTRELMGTPSYMAPEQAVANHDPLTSATDVYGLGAILYQLLTGRPPFAAGTAYETIKLLLESDPRPPRSFNPKIGRDLATICLHCLEKNPKLRYPSARALAEDLERWLRHEPIQARHTPILARGAKWVRRNPTRVLLAASLLALTTAAGWIVAKSDLVGHPMTNGIAVLPLDNLNREADSAYFVDGIQDEILTRLTKISELQVISRSSTERYQKKPRNLAQIAKQLGVANFLEGTVFRAADQVRISVQLINAHTGRQLWAETYDRKLNDLFQVETEIATAVADILKAKLTRSQEQAMAGQRATSPEAYELYLRGRFFWNKRTGADLRKAIDFFNLAIANDPNYALAHAGLADCYDLLSEYGEVAPKAGYPKAKAEAVKALSLDDKLAEAHASLGYSLINYDWDWRKAEKEYQRAIQLNPNYATAHQWYAECLMTQARHTEAIAEARQAERLDPLSLIISQGVGGKYFYARRYDEAIEQFRRTLELYPNFPMTHQRLGRCYAQKRMYEEAIAATQRAVELSGNSTQMIAALGYIYAAAGRRDAAQGVISELERRSKESYVDAYFVATIFAALGEKDKAFACLNKALAERSKWLSYLHVDFQLDNLRSDRRFDALVRRVFGP